MESKKSMMIIVWNPTGFLRIAALRKGGRFNTDSYISEILASLAKWRAGQVGAMDRKLIIDSDNVRPGPHAPSSPDLASCDFFRCISLKNQPMRQSSDDTKHLLMVINEICEFFENAVLEKVFHGWRERLAK
jgi:hypothetical protein